MKTSILTHVMYVAAFSLAQTSGAAPITESACFDACSKAVRGIESMDDAEFLLKYKGLDLSARSAEIQKMVARGLKKSLVDTAELPKMTCHLIVQVPSFVEDTNKRLQQFVDLGVLTAEDLLTTAKTEL